MSVQVFGQSGNVKVLPTFQNPNRPISTLTGESLQVGDVAYFRTIPKNLLGVGLQGGLAMTQITNTQNLMNQITKKLADQGHPECECVWVRTSGIRPSFNTIFDFTVEYAVANTSNTRIVRFIDPITLALIITFVASVLLAVYVGVSGLVTGFWDIAREVWQEIKQGWEDLPQWARSGLTVGLFLVIGVGILILIIGISGIGVNVSKKGVSTTSSKRRLGVKTKYGSVNV